MMDPKNAFWIINSYLGAPEDTLAVLMPRDDAVNAVVAFVAERGADPKKIRDGAEHLLFELAQHRIDVSPEVRAVKANDVVRSALIALDNIAALEKALDPHEQSRLFVAAAKALAVRDEAAGIFEDGVDPVLLAMTGRDRERLQERLGYWLGGLRAVLEDVVTAHGGPKPRSGRPPRDSEAESLASVANFYVHATGRRPTFTTDPDDGAVTGDLVDFAGLLCSYTGNVPFTDHDFRELQKKLPKARTKMPRKGKA
jgi:hypothetical protein